MIDKVKMDTGQLRERNRQRTNERIVDAAAELFRDRGYDHTTMDEIAAHAEVSRATLFNYFPTKESLLAPFVDEMLRDHIRPSISAFLATRPDTFEALRFLFKRVHEFVLDVPNIDQALKREFLRTEYLGRRDLDNDEFRQIIVELLRYGQRSGEIRRDIPAEKQAAYLSALYGSVVLDALLNSEFKDYPQKVEDLLNFIRLGLRPQ